VRTAVLICCAVIATVASTRAGSAPYERTFTGSGLHARVTVMRPLIGKTTLRVTLTDVHDRAVGGAWIVIHIDMASMSMNPSGSVPLREAHPGAYERTIDLPMPGHWKADIHIAATGGKSTTLTLPFFVDLP